jgi:ligand-binding sensor domain-containing protein/serine phosphatase RsbU (regulator of sigma subunit)
MKLFTTVILVFVIQSAFNQITTTNADSVELYNPGKGSIPVLHQTQVVQPHRTQFIGIKRIHPGRSARYDAYDESIITALPLKIPYKNFENNSSTIIEQPEVITPYYVDSVQVKSNMRRGLIETIRAGLPDKKPAGKALYKDNSIINVKYNDIAQDSNQTIWMGTFGSGLSAYDGQSFWQYSKKQGLRSNSIVELLFDSKGNLWLGTYKHGAICFNGTDFQYFNTSSGLPGNQIMALHEDREGNIWIGSDNGMTKFTGEKLVVYSEKQGLNVRQINDIAEDQKGNLWVATFNSGFYQFDGKNFVHYTTNNNLPTNMIWNIISDKNNSIWLGSFGEGIIQFDGKNFYQYASEQGIQGTEILSTYLDRCGDLWFGTDGNGLYNYDGEAFTNLSTDQGLANDKIWDLLEDATGNYWIASFGGGLMQYDGGVFNHITEKQGLPGNIMLSFCEDDEHNKWLGIWNKGLVKFDGKDFYTYNQYNGLPSTTIWDIKKDNQNRLWLATDGSGVIVFNGHTFTQYTQEQGLPHNEVISIYIDESQNVWAGTFGGLVCIQPNNTVKPFTEKQGLYLKEIRHVTHDKYNNLWIASSDNGLAVLVGDTFYHFNKQHGLCSNDTRKLFFDQAGNLWVGTSNQLSVINKSFIEYIGTADSSTLRSIGEKELYSLFSSSITTLSTKNGLASDMIKTILSADNNEIWLGTEHGISHLIPAKTSSKSGNNVEVFHDVYTIENYSYSEGYIGGDVFSNNSAGVDHTGQIWWGTGKMISQYRKPFERVDTMQLSVRINDLELFFEPIDWTKQDVKNNPLDQLKKKLNIPDQASINYSGIKDWTFLPEELTISHQINHLTFNFNATSWRGSETVKYAFMLDGYEENWNPTTRLHKSTYSNLPPGKYTFKVKAYNSKGQWSNTAKFHFMITPPWWQTIWAKVMGVVVLFLILFGVYRWRIESYRYRQRELEGLVVTRTKEIQEKNEELLQQTEEILAQRNELESKKDQLEIIHRDLTESIEYAKRIQSSMFTDQLILTNFFSDNMLLFYPRDRVSGDFYWWAHIDAKIVIAIADCTGHGVPGALMSMLGMSFLREIVMKEQQTVPGTILDRLRDEIITSLNQSLELGEQRDGMDISIVSFDAENQKLQYAGARNPLILIRDGKLLEYKADKAPISIYLKMQPFTTQTIDIKTNDQFYMFSDGYADQFGGQYMKKFNKSRFKQLLETNAHLSMANQQAILINTFQKWKGVNEQIDDIVVFGVKV